MMYEGGTLTIITRKRPWWQWVLAFAWLLSEVLLLQTALASMKEEEYRAGSICWIALIILATAGVIAWLRQRGFRWPDESGREH